MWRLRPFVFVSESGMLCEPYFFPMATTFAVISGNSGRLSRKNHATEVYPAMCFGKRLLFSTKVCRNELCALRFGVLVEPKPAQNPVASRNAPLIIGFLCIGQRGGKTLSA